MIGALVATCGGPGATPSPSPAGAPWASPPATSPTEASPGATTPAVTPIPSAPAGTTGWAPLDLAPAVEVASLTATRAGAGGVAPTTAFRLTSLDGTAPRAMAARLVVTPPIEVAIARETATVAELRPTKPLREGQVYRFELRRADDTAEAAWAVQAAWPLRVASTIPGDATTGVPRTTGIEVSFDQPGVKLADLRSNLMVSPRVDGRFEQHGQTFVLVPDKPLKPATLYTVTVRHGLPLPGTGMTLEQDAIVRFETTGGPASRTHLSMGRTLFDAATNERTAIGIDVYREDEEDDEDGASVRSVKAQVHRLPSLAAATEAFQLVRATPEWTERSSTTPVGTASLPLTLQGTFTLRAFVDGEGEWFQLPRALPAGWYVVTVTVEAISRQAVLQVTDLAAYAMVSRTRSLVWVNDLRTNRAVPRARVTLGGTAFGQTGAEGLAVGRTPRSLLNPDGPAAAVAVVRSAGRAVLVPLAADWCEKCGGSQDSDWWHLLTTDRAWYRSTDTVNVWGVVRNRDSGRVPQSVTAVLKPSEGGASQPVIVSATAAPDRSGSWLTRLALRDVPPGDYVVSVTVGGHEVASRWLNVGPIVKPAWQVELATPHRAVLSGTSAQVSATATFFEGTPVAGASLRIGTGNDESEDEDSESEPTSTVARTDGSGRAVASVPLVLGEVGEDSWEDDLPGQWSVVEITGNAREPEEGDIGAALPVAVFRSTAVLDTSAELVGRTLTITGSVHDVAFGRFDAPGMDLWAVDPRGAVRPNATVSLRVTEIRYVTRQTGTRYDFIAKQTVPIYETTSHRTSLGSRTATTASDGSFRLAMAVSGGGRRYEVQAGYVDEADRSIQATAEATTSAAEPETSWPSLVAPGRDESWGEYRVGDTIRVRFQGGIANPQVERFLFAVLARGMRSVSVQGGDRFSTPFSAGLVPDVAITAVRFTGTGYEVVEGGFGASLRIADRTLDVRLSGDRARYAPGDRVTVSVQTLDATGHPVSASVFVRAVDEKLFAIGAAEVEDPLDELYASAGSGLITSGWSHAGPGPNNGLAGGDTTGGGGGGERTDFRDWLISKLVTTGTDGRASVSFDLSDDLTSWRFLASAVTPRLEAGQASILLPVSLSFFADAIVAPEYLTVDRPVIRVRAFGTALRDADRVTFKVSSGTLPMATRTVVGTAFQPVEIPLPKLSTGSHRLRIEAIAGSGANLRTDVLVRTFQVVDTRALRSHTTSVPLVTGTTVGGGSGLTTVTLADAGRGRVMPLLRELAASQPYRADTALAAAIARDLLADAFGIPDDPALPEADLTAFQAAGGLSIVPYGSPELELTALAALSGDRRLNRSELRWFFQDVLDETEGSLPTDRALLVLLGRASIGEASLGEVSAAAARADLTPAQRVTVALSALAVGDEPLARQIERDLLASHGERRGSWVRLHVGSAENTALATARLAIVAAALGDPIAADMDAEVAAHPPIDTLVDLERVIAAARWTQRMPKATAVAAVTIDGRRSEVTVTGDRAATFVVTPAQREGLRIDPVRGSVIVVAQWDGTLGAGDLESPYGQSISRMVTPAGAIGATDTVVVSFEVRLGSQADDGCWRVTDLTPSGLAPILGRWSWDEDEGDGPVGPWRIVGQRVDFCLEPDTRRPTQTLRYLARIVTPGTYRWEPAVLQSSLVPEQGIILPASEVTVRGLGS